MSKCQVVGCLNSSDGGEFVGEFCKPCYDIITGKHLTGYQPPFKVWSRFLGKTDYECFQNMLKSLDIGFRLERLESESWNKENLNHNDDVDQIIIGAKEGNNIIGYSGFECVFYFTLEGKFLKVGVWE